jgi:hypothetical protein
MERLVFEVADLDATTLQVSAMPTFASMGRASPRGLHRSPPAGW